MALYKFVLKCTDPSERYAEYYAIKLSRDDCVNSFDDSDAEHVMLLAFKKEAESLESAVKTAFAAVKRVLPASELIKVIKIEPK